jgi:hypothetical protein
MMHMEISAAIASPQEIATYSRRMVRLPPRHQAAASAVINRSIMAMAASLRSRTRPLLLMRSTTVASVSWSFAATSLTA